MYVTLEQAKAHCNVLSHEFDDLLHLYISAAEKQAENYLNQSLAVLCGEPPDPENLPPPVRVGILYYVADMFSQRETFVVGTVLANSPIADRLLYPYRAELGA